MKRKGKHAFGQLWATAPCRLKFEKPDLLIAFSEAATGLPEREFSLPTLRRPQAVHVDFNSGFKVAPDALGLCQMPYRFSGFSCS